MDSDMHWQKAEVADLSECLDLHPGHLGDEIVGRRRAIQAWKDLIQSAAFRSAVIRSASPISGQSIVGFGASVFVSRPFARAEVANPMPGLNGRILESIDSGRSVVANYQQLREANTIGDLQLVILYGSWRKGLLTPDQVCQVQMLLAHSFQQLHAGFRVGRMLTELVDPEDLQYACALPAWRILDRFDRFHRENHGPAWNRHRGLAIVTRESAFADPGSIVTGLFHHREPTLRLRPGEQQLLEMALGGLTDEELAVKLYLTVPAIKRRWAAIFEHIGEIRPALAAPKEGSTRGPQKRHRVLAHVREHPEELRPFSSLTKRPCSR